VTHKSHSLPVFDILVALAVVVVWGTNFVVIKFALAHLPPLLLACLRFTLAFVPAAFFIQRPAVPLVHLASYGILIGVGQFGLLYIAMEHDISPGLVSLVIQTQVFFTIALSIWFSGEHVRLFQWCALALAASGLGLIMLNSGHDVTPLGLGLVLLAAASWGGGNHIARASPNVNMLGYVVWASAFAVPPLIVLSLLFDGVPAITQGLRDADAATWAAVLYQSVGNTLFGYACWGWLLSRHPAATISPFALLVPVVGMATAAWTLHEALPAWKLAAAGLVLGGLALNLSWPRVAAAVRVAWRRKGAPPSTAA
jgi:O-acetylserine/cysteine efflux transporter